MHRPFAIACLLALVGSAFALAQPTATVQFREDISTSAGLAALLGDETGTGLACFATAPTLAGPIITGKVKRNDVAVDDDDCTGEQGFWWYDTTDFAFEFCNANSGAPAVLGSSAGDIEAVGDCLSGPAFVNDTNCGSQLIFEGATVDTNQTTLTFTGDPGGDFTVTIPNTTGTIETQNNKNAASGYAGLDAGSRIAKAQAPSTTVYTDQANTFGTGFKQTFTPPTGPTPANSSIGIGVVEADPSTSFNGDIWIATDAAPNANRLSWRSNGTKFVRGENHVYSDAANVYDTGRKQTFQASTTTAGLNLLGTSADPSVLANGDIWHHTSEAAIKFRTGGVTKTVARLDSPVFTGDPTAPTPAAADNDTSLATTAHVQAQKVSPVFTGTPTAPTPLTSSNSTLIATTQFVKAQSRIKCINIDPAHATTDWLFWKAKNPINVLTIDCIVDAATSVVLTLRECDSSGGNCTNTEAAMTCTTTNTPHSAPIDDPTIDTDDWIRVLRGTVTGSPAQAILCMHYQLTG